MKTRNIGVSLIFSLMTCGLYEFYWLCKLTDETNEVSNIKTVSGEVACIYDFITCGLYGWFWFYKQGQKLDEIRGTLNSNTGILFIILRVFGLQLVALAIMQDSLNKINNKER